MIIEIEIDDGLTSPVEALTFASVTLIKAIRYSCGNEAESLTHEQIIFISKLAEQLSEKVPAIVQHSQN